MGVQKPTTIEEIRSYLESNLGKKIFIRANQGRRRYLESEESWQKPIPNCL